MAETLLPLSHRTILDTLDAFFRARPGQWIDGRGLQRVAGAYAWRSRVSDLRTQRGLDITNRQRRVRTAGQRRVTISEYRYVPPADAPVREGEP